MSSLNMDHVTYLLGLFSLAFVFYLFVNLLLSLYDNSGRNAPSVAASDLEAPVFKWSRGMKQVKPAEEGYVQVRPEGEARPTVDSGTQDEFELSDRYWAEESIERHAR
jgi:hypothetical protein